jgi:hypothetical protein
MDSIQKGDFKLARSYLSNDFQFSGSVPQPMDGDEWMGLCMILKKAFPDLDYHFQVKSMEGDSAIISTRLNGTHSGYFDLTALHMGVIPATNRPIAAAQEYGRVTVKDGLVASWANIRTEGAGLLAILRQLGIDPPTR